MPLITQCRACGHPDRRALDAALAAGSDTLVEIAEKFGLTKSGLDRHWQRHAGPAAAAATAAVGGRWDGRPLPAPRAPKARPQVVPMPVVDMAPEVAARAAALRAQIARMQARGGAGWGTMATLRGELAALEAGRGETVAG